MKQFTVRLEDAQVEQLEEMMKAHGLSKSQAAFEMMVCAFENLREELAECVETGRYWQDEHDKLAAEYSSLTKQTDLLRGIIEKGLGKKVI